jgi:hypothetical protein
MRDRLFRFATATAVFGLIALCPKVQAQQENRQAAGGQSQTQTGRQEGTRTAGEMEMVRGVVAAITAEGEVMLDYRTNTAAKSEAAFLTIIGSPVKSEASETAGRTAATGTERADTDPSHRRRHNVYIAWLTPRTKICDAKDDRGQEGQNRDANAASSTKKELALDQLEVGDHVEIKFSHGDNSASNAGVHQTQQMRQKHGRHRTFVGFATEVTVLPHRDHDQSSSTATGTGSDRPK